MANFHRFDGDRGEDCPAFDFAINRKPSLARLTLVAKFEFPSGLFWGRKVFVG
ncbi:hypothetical protein G8O24_39565 [Bradyrhizobium sp. INPA01-394B]|uniref:hypothetical protein n=1 Tax=Nitrobacteraceae TaxID=41294 RepID=UPI0012FB8C95|nr:MULTISPECIES: hypothetical protein [Nitrobacteraceae]MBC9883390.1 hypothetical protein [Bradyrhizobium campsiandrae]MBQ8105592.1 hypothetical protein [Afipia sp.]